MYHASVSASPASIDVGAVNPSSAVARDVSQVQKASLATGGAVVVELKPELVPATKADVAAIAAALDRLERRLPSR